MRCLTVLVLLMPHRLRIKAISCIVPYIVAYTYHRVYVATNLAKVY